MEPEPRDGRPDPEVSGSRNDEVPRNSAPRERQGPDLGGRRGVRVAGEAGVTLPDGDRIVRVVRGNGDRIRRDQVDVPARVGDAIDRSEEHTSELQSQSNLVCRLLLEKKKKTDE